MNYLDLIKTLDREFSDEELKAIIRGYRNRELTASDWTQMPDSPLTNKAEWIAYRRDLRDMPQQGPDPKEWIFPVRPA